MIPQYLLLHMGIWVAEFAACLSGPNVMYDRGEICTRYNLDTDRWAVIGQVYDGVLHEGQTVDLRDIAVMQNRFPCGEPFGCATNQSDRRGEPIR